ncbi:unnamed protein product, partial [Brenthis ino]
MYESPHKATTNAWLRQPLQTCLNARQAIGRVQPKQVCEMLPWLPSVSMHLATQPDLFTRRKVYKLPSIAAAWLPSADLKSNSKDNKVCEAQLNATIFRGRQFGY